MNENLIEKVCASPNRWLFIAVTTFVIALLSVLPQVDIYLDARNERYELLEQLDKANEMAHLLPEYETAAKDKQAQVEELRKQEVQKEQIPELRSWLVSSARQAGCQVRRIDFSSSSKKPWDPQTDPLKRATKQELNQRKSPFDLEKRPVSLSVTGSPEEVKALLRTLDKDMRLKHTSTVEMRPIGRNTQNVQLDLTLWYFALVKAKGVS